MPLSLFSSSGRRERSPAAARQRPAQRAGLNGRRTKELRSGSRGSPYTKWMCRTFSVDRRKQRATGGRAARRPASRQLVGRNEAEPNCPKAIPYCPLPLKPLAELRRGSENPMGRNGGGEGSIWSSSLSLIGRDDLLNQESVGRRDDAFDGPFHSAPLPHAPGLDRLAFQGISKEGGQKRERGGKVRRLNKIPERKKRARCAPSTVEAQ